MYRFRPALRGILLPLTSWVVGTAVAVSVGFVAIDRVGNDLNRSSTVPLSDAELRQSALAAARSTAPSLTTAPSPASSPPQGSPTAETGDTGAQPTVTADDLADGRSRRFTTDGGVVAASCSGTEIALLYAYPVEGYTSHIERESNHIEVKFAARSGEVELTLHCVDGEPTDQDGDHHSEPERTPTR